MNAPDTPIRNPVQPERDRAGGWSAPAPRRRFDLTSVRRRDVWRLRRAGPPPGVRLPAKHGADGDPRYPSPTTLRGLLAFVLDLVLHLAVAVGAVAGASLVTDSGWSLVAAPAGFLAASLVDRIAVQRLASATFGKAVTGLCVVRDDTGGPPTTGSLVKVWFLGAALVVLEVLTS